MHTHTNDCHVIYLNCLLKLFNLLCLIPAHDTQLQKTPTQFLHLNS